LVTTDTFAVTILPDPPALSGDLILAVDETGAQAARSEPIPRPVLSLIRAVVTADAAAFAAAAAAAAQAVVTVVGSDGSVIASSSERSAPRAGSAWEPAGEAREILLRDEAGLHGAIRISPGQPGSTPAALADLGRLLGDLGLVLIRSLQSGQRQRILENQLVMLTCLSARDTEGAFWPDCAVDSRTPRRLAIVTAAGRIDGHAGTRLHDAVVRAAERTGVLSGLCMVTSQGSLVGLYPDTDQPLARHRRSWAQVLRSAGLFERLTVAVGAAVSERGDFPAQHHLLGEITRIQQSGSRYFNLPAVAMLDELGPLAEVIGATPGRGFAPFVERVLGDLLDDTRFGGQLIETLYAYLQTGGSPREAGALLHLHPSTVKYRIRVIRELLGPRLADQGSRLDIELAVRLCLAAGVPRGPGRPSDQGGPVTRPLSRSSL
jgi:PucR C-terminal helix-turn-helix domain